ncbi:hypothetical protein [Cellulomonas gilvus]|uniref:Vegetative protein n=1 Tax=Cellulomonas gilvus (strain ATCC 13127 / NRRL B-14078) TaxID=593907 RepID=F8A2F0_CELGA|nr:hypothetical protein [Cellulomonas gilvus]AEI11807.1 vegetative protein [Cellulomonas gilvus ATCC 13127]
MSRGISDPAMLRLADMRRRVHEGDAATLDVLMGLAEVVAALAEAVAALTPATPPAGGAGGTKGAGQ